MHGSDKPRLNIRAIRENRGYTQEYMAEMLNICQSTYANLESGKTSLSINRLLHITEILDIDIHQLFDQYQRQEAPQEEKAHREMSTSSGLTPEVKHVYDQLIFELRTEIDFLRSLVRHHHS